MTMTAAEIAGLSDDELRIAMALADGWHYDGHYWFDPDGKPHGVLTVPHWPTDPAAALERLRRVEETDDYTWSLHPTYCVISGLDGETWSAHSGNHARAIAEAYALWRQERGDE